MPSPEIDKTRATIRERIPHEKAFRPKYYELCKNPCASNSFVEWQDETLPPSLNYEFNFTVPDGRQAVIELITATVIVPVGEWARLRLFTSIGTSPGNFDLTLKPQGAVDGQTIYVATHPLKVYTDSLLAINVNRDNATTSGYALISIGGYLLG